MVREEELRIKPCSLERAGRLRTRFSPFIKRWSEEPRLGDLSVSSPQALTCWKEENNTLLRETK